LGGACILHEMLIARYICMSTVLKNKDRGHQICILQRFVHDIPLLSEQVLSMTVVCCWLSFFFFCFGYVAFLYNFSFSY
jgi:hypothetical protein